MLKKFGWREGDSLGAADNKGITEPVRERERGRERKRERERERERERGGRGLYSKLIEFHKLNKRYNKLII